MRLTPLIVPATGFLAVLTSCVGPAPSAPRPAVTPPPSAPAPAPVQPARPAPVATEWLYRPVVPGTWTYQSDGTGSVARFGAALTVRCDRAARRVSIIRSGSALGGSGQGAMIVRTSFGAVTWPAVAIAGAVPQVSAVRAASDATLDQVAYSRGKFAIELSGQAPLIVPAWPEVARVIEDCRG